MIASDFKEVAHCGFRFKVITRLGQDGHRLVQFQVTGSRPNAMTICPLYVLPPGIPIAMGEIAGIGQSPARPPFPECLQIYLGSDSEGRFGHECPRCKGYWRSEGPPLGWAITCAYCGAQGGAHNFLTAGQKRYVHASCDLILTALNDEAVGEKEINLDEAADLAAQGCKPPPFYYSEQSQQTQYTCAACKTWNDVLGRFAYCSNCGTRNDLQHFESVVGGIREQINRGTAWEQDVKDLVSAFDSTTQQFARQFVARVPMIESRRNRFKDRLFHNLKSAVDDFKTVFGIDLLKGGESDDERFGSMMFARRHVYEHKGGVADERYLEESGDAAVRAGELLRETRDNCQRLATLVLRMARNLHAGFHEVFPPLNAAIESAKRWGKIKS